MTDILDSSALPEKLPSEQRVQILLVDDQPAHLLDLDAILENLPYNLVRARSDEEAVQQLLGKDFALILLNVQAASLDMFETANLIRRQEASRRIPILFLTEREPATFLIEQAYSLGAVDFLVKPLVPVIVRAKIAGFVDLFEKTRQVQQQAERIGQLERGESAFLQDLSERQRLEQVLRQSEERQQALTDFLSDVTCVARIGERGVPELESVSAGFTRISGYTFEELSARGGVPITIYPEDMLVVLRSLEQVLSGEQDRNEIRMIRKDGDIRWIRYLAQPVWDANQGRVSHVRAMAQDVTERKLAVQVVEESERRFRQLAENINEVFWLSDPAKSQILYVSPAYEKIWGRSCQSLYEQPLSYLEAIHADDRQAVIAAIDKQSQGEWTGVEYRIVRPDGVMRWIWDRGFPIKDEAGEVQRVAGIAEDVTERKRSEEALREADRRKDEFLATLAHELRNPLAPIRNSLQILKMSRVDEAMVARSREMIERQVHQLVRLVDDLLDVSRVMRGKIELRKEQVDLAAVVTRAVETAQPHIEAQGHELSITLPAEVLFLNADPVRLVQVVGNLLMNAAKYTEAKGHIWLTAQREGAEAVLRLRDSGIGISPEMLSRIFELFVQVDHAATRSQGGLGIGLTLVKNLVEMHHGTIKAWSAGLGKGSEFEVRFPLALPEFVGQEGAEQPQSRTSSGRRLLVVDDNRDAAESLALLLSLQGHEVRVAHDGPAALEMAQDYQPEMVFLDLGMPGMDGYEVAQRLRRQPGLKNVVLAALTGWGQEEARRLSAASGFNHHLVKPVEPKTLEGLLADLQG